MFTVRIREKGGDDRVLTFDKEEVSIGRGKGNDIILPKGNVSKRHARIVHRDDKFIVVDLRSTNGTYFNARKISSPVIVTPQDKIYVGDFVLRILPGMPDESYTSGPPSEPISFPDEMMGPPAPPEPPALDIEPPDLDVEPPFPPPAPAWKEPPAVPPRMEVPPPPQPVRQAADTTHELDEELYQSTKALDIAAMEAEVAAPLYAPDMELEIPIETEAPSEPELEIPVDMEADLTPSPEAVPSYLAPEPAFPEPEPAYVAPEPVFAEPERMRRPARPTFVPEATPLPVAVTPQPVPSEGIGALVQRLARRLVTAPDLVEAAEADDRGAIRSAVIQAVEEAYDAGELDSAIDPTALAARLADAGPLELLAADPEVEEVSALAHDRIFVRRLGLRARATLAFPHEAAFTAEVRRLLGRLGATDDEPPPFFEGTLGGMRLRVLAPPLAATGFACQIQKAPEIAPDLDELVESGALDADAAQFLAQAVSGGRSILVVGPPRSGRTRLLGAMALAIPETSFVVLAEERPEIRLPHPAVLKLQLDEDPGEGFDLLRRLRRVGADVLVMGAVPADLLPGFVEASFESAAQVLAGATGRDLDGFLQHVLGLYQSAGGDLPRADAVALLAQAFDLLVQTERGPAGETRVRRIAELALRPEGGLQLTDAIPLQ